MKVYLPSLGLILLLLHSMHCGAEDNWEETCPTSCECKWYNNKRVAYCSNAGFSTIPSTLSSAIQVLDLTSNNIQSLGENTFKMVNLINLHKLVLAKNKISYIHHNAFNSLKILMDLDLSNNQIEKLHPETFSGMEKMRKLILDGNILSRLEAFQFPELTNLQHLLINNCRLSYINNHAFSNLQQITSVGLKGNKLTVLEPELFISRPTLKSVELGDNLWICDCNLRKLIYWIQKEKKGENQVACHSPERVAGKKWLALEENDLACSPEIIIPQREVSISLGGNATLSCGSRGEPLPTMKWILDGRLLTNMSELTIPFSKSDPNVKFLIKEDLVDGLFWTNLTVIQIGEDFMLHGYDPSSPFKCVVENPAKMIERNVTLVIGTVVESPIITGSYLDIYIIIAIVTVGILVLVLVILICVCCLRKRKNESPNAKTIGTDKAFMERNNILIVNPVEKPPRKNEQYEKLPQADIELTDLTKSTHKNFEEMNYPEERVGRVRSPLTPLEEEEFDQSSQKLLNDSLNTTTTLDYALQFPDLLDNVKFPRAVSPTQLSYHSLINPMYSPNNPDWRYSYVYPSEYNTPTRYNPYSSTQPQLYQRPGYVTLPRRPRTSSVTSAPLVTSSQISPTFKVDPIYDTLGPRTTADGTSRTDLTRPMSRSMIDPYNPPTPLSPASPPLPLHYVPLSVERNSLPGISRQSTTLPRSTPNLLDEKGLSIPHREVKKDKKSAADKAVSKVPDSRPSTDKISKVTATQKVSPSSSDVPKTKTSPLNKPPHSNGALKSLKPSSKIINDASNDATTPPKKKVPPKPPPKPVNKRLSISSTTSDTGSRQSSLNYQDEGPDGTEV